jgi:capsular polysaccharide transport system permease protein
MRLAQLLRRSPELVRPLDAASDRQLAASRPVVPAPRPGTESGSLPAVLEPRNPAVAGPAPRFWGRLPQGRMPLRLLSFVALVVLPTAITASYYFAVATDQYVAEFRFTLSSADAPRFDPMSLFAGNQVQSPASIQSQILVQYITSRAIVDRIDASLDLRRFFAPPQADWWSRLAQPASIEELVRYWKGQIDPFYDPANGTVMVRVRAFLPGDALRLSEAIVAACEKLVNELSLRVRNDALHHAEAELARAEARLKSVLGEIRAFRDREGLIDPTKSAEASGLLATRLRDDLIKAKADLATLKSYMRDNAPSVKVLTARIRSLETQRRLLGREMTDPARSDTLSRALGTYEQLESERKFAEAAYHLALRGLDQARANADRQRVFIASFVPPSLPEEALYPRRWRSLGTVALIAFAFWGIGGLAAQSVRDHLS